MGVGETMTSTAELNETGLEKNGVSFPTTPQPVCAFQIEMGPLLPLFPPFFFPLVKKPEVYNIFFEQKGASLLYFASEGHQPCCLLLCVPTANVTKL